MNSFVSELGKFVKDEEGTELVEWGLIAGLVIVLAAAVFALIGGDLNTIFSALRQKTSAGASNAG